MTRTFDALDLDKPVVKLGPSVQFTLGDITSSRQKKLMAVAEQLDAIDTESPDQTDAFIEAVCALVDAACEEPGAGAAVKALWDAETIGAKVLGDLVVFIQEWLTEQSSGEASSPSSSAS